MRCVLARYWKAQHPCPRTDRTVDLFGVHLESNMIPRYLKQKVRLRGMSLRQTRNCGTLYLRVNTIIDDKIIEFDLINVNPEAN